MAEKISNFLHYGASAVPIESVAPSVAEDFVPSLVLRAMDDPSMAPSLLFPLVSNQRTPKAMAYASLDFQEVRQLVLLEEERQQADIVLSEGEGEATDSEDGCWEREWQVLKRHHSVDEFLTFEAADEINRATLAIRSLRKRAYEFYVLLNSETDVETCWIQQCKDEGSIWSNEVFIPELLSLLPIAVYRCPELLEPEILIKGLLTTKYGAALLASALINNPLAQQRGAMLLADFLSEYVENSEMYRFYPAFYSLTDNKDAVQHKLHPVISHCIQQALWVFVFLCRLVPEMASMCREALVRKCIFPDMIIHITVELLHDELQFFSSILFGDRKISAWMLSFFRSLPKKSLPFLPRLSQTESLSKQLRELSGAGLTPPCGKDEGIIQHFQKALLADAEATFHDQGWRGRLHSHLRLYCVIIHAGDLQPTHEEIKFWLNALGGKIVGLEQGAACQPQKLPTERTLQLGIALLCLVPGLMSSSTKSLYYGCILFLLKPVVSGLASSDLGEMALWLVVQLLLQNYSDVVSFVRDAVGMDVRVHSSSVRDLCDAAAATGITSDPSSVTKATASFRLFDPISSTRFVIAQVLVWFSFFPVLSRKNADLLLKCLYQLMKSGHFIRFGVDISEVVMHCISLSTEPIHPMLSELIQMFAEETLLYPQADVSSWEFKMKPLPSRFLVMSIKPACSCDNMHGIISEKERKRSLTSYYEAGDQKKYAFSHKAAAFMPAAALATFYIFCREQVLQNAGIYIGYRYTGSVSIQVGNNEEIWWSKLLAALPLHSLLVYMENHWLAYEHLFPQWLGLASHLFPERLLVQSLLQDSEEPGNRLEIAIEEVPVVEDLEWVGAHKIFFSSVEADEGSKTSAHGPNRHFSMDMVHNVFRNALAQPLPAFRLLKAIQLDITDNKAEAQSAVISDLVPLLLEESCARALQKGFCEWWRSLPHSELEPLVPQLFNSIKTTCMDVENTGSSDQQNLKSSLVNLELSKFVTSYAELAEEPLALLACKNKVFHTPLLSVLLELLMELLVRNRRICLTAISEGEGNSGLKQGDIMGALAAQDSAVCQIVLEACLENASLGEFAQQGPMLEAQRLICAFISSLFETTPILVKLIHFQGYDKKLVPMMVEGVLAMVHCFEFVHELLQKPQQSKQVFAIVLIANLVQRYPNHPQSLATAQQAVRHASAMQNKLIDDSDILIETLEPLAWCAVTFPSLVSEVIMLLQSCLQVACPPEPSNAAHDKALHNAAIAAFQLFIRQKILPGRVFS